MELRLANIISSLFYGVKIFVTDIESFSSRVQFFLHDYFSRKIWNLEIEKSKLGMGSVGFAEISRMLSVVGIGGLDECGEEDMVALFDEEEPSFDEIKEAFKVFDVNEDGFIDGAELQRVVCSLGLKEACSLDDCKRMIHRFDANGDGFIDFHEFLKFMEIICLSSSS